MVHFHPFSIANCNNYQRVTSHDHHPWAEVQDLALLFQVRGAKTKGAVFFFRLKLARFIKWGSNG